MWFAALLLVTVPNGQAAITVQNYYRLGETEPVAGPGLATNTLDSVGTRHLSVAGAPFYSTNVGAEAMARVGSSLSLNFSGGQVAGTGVISDVTNNFGLEMWVKPTTDSGNRTVIYNGNGGNSGWGIVQLGNTYQVLFGGVLFFGSAPVTLNTWTHLAIVRNAGTATFYMDGVAYGTTTSAPNKPGGSFNIGESFNGFIDEVRFFTFAAGEFTTNDLLRVAPGMGVRQPAGTSIADGGSRHFGSLNVSASASLTFTVTNTGLSSLTGIGITIDGTDAGQFSVTASPAATVALGGSTSFTIQFTPTSVGFKTATLHLTSNDPNEGSFDILLHGAGEALTVQNYYRMGENDPNPNPGAASATRDGIGGKHLTTFASPFYSTDVGTEAVARVASSRSLLVFTSTHASGALLSAVTDNFGLEAWIKPASLSGNQCIAYNGSTGTNGWGLYLVGSSFQGVFGGVTNFGTGTATLNTWTHVALVRNAGTATLYVNGVAAGTTTTAPVAPAGIFAVGKAPPSLSADLLQNAYLDEVRFFTFQSGQFSTNNLLRVAPEIAVQQPAGSNVADGGSRDFGTVNLATNASLTFTITNTGLSSLTGLGVTIDGESPTQFSVTASPAETVAVGGATTFTVRFAPTSLGVKNATLQIASNDGNENPFDIALSGIGSVSSNAELTGLALSTSPLVPVFASGITSYVAGASLDATNYTFSVTNTTYGWIDFRINNGAYTSLASATPTSPLTLSYGSNTLEVRVRSQDGTVTNYYNVTLMRANPTVEHYYRMGEDDPGATDNGLASTLRDAVGSQHLTGVNQPIYSLGTSAEAAARAGSSLSTWFGSPGRYATSALLSTLTDNFTMEVWAKPTTATGNHTLAYNGSTGSSGWGLMQIGNTYQVLFGGVTFFGSGTVVADAWTHLALVRSDGTSTFYVNGVASGTTTQAPNTPAGMFAVGISPTTLNSDQFSGYLDELRFSTFAPGQFSTNFLLRGGGGTTYSVTSLEDTGTGSGNAGDLRYCLTRANTNPVSTIFLNVNGTITLARPLPVIFEGVTIDGRLAPNTIISGSNQHRIFFVDAPGRSVNLRSLNLANGRAKGGDGGPSGGGGLGAGGALFVNSGTVILSSVNMSNCTAQGGRGGNGGINTGGGGGGLGGQGGNGGEYNGGGGGGFFGNGGNGSPFIGGGAGGGGGIYGNGGQPDGFYGGGGGGTTDASAAPTPGAGGGLGGQANWQTVLDHSNVHGGHGSFGGGGGGAGEWEPFASPPRGGNGGTYGGGGGGSTDFGFHGGRAGSAGDFGGGGGGVGRGGGGGNGGFGGGGGGSSKGDSEGTPPAGPGGFGAGGGGGSLVGGAAGSYAGRGGFYQSFVNGYVIATGAGGGGAALGGAVFVRSGTGATVEFNNGTESASAGTAGVAGTAPAGDEFFRPVYATDGQSAGSAIFLPAGYTTFRSGTIVNEIAGLSGAALRKLADGTLTLTSANAYDGGTAIEAGVLAISNSSALGTGAISMNGGTLRNTASVTLPNPVTLGAGGATFDLSGGMLTFSSALNGVGSLQKSGAYTLTLATANTYGGGTTISAGTLLANNPTGSATGPGNVMIATGATLSGTGSLGGSTTVAGTLAPGVGAGLLTFATNLTLAGTSTNVMELAGTSRGAINGYDAINVGDTCTFGGRLKIVLLGGFTPVAGDSFNLFDWGNRAGSFAALELPSLPGTLVWYTNALYTSGTLTVVDLIKNDPPTLDAIANVTINEDAGAQLVSLAGIGAGTGESQALSITATSSDTNLVTKPTVTYTSPAATGSLNFATVTNASGTATITVTITDDASVDGTALSLVRTFTVTVNAVNDAPSFTKGANQSVPALLPATLQTVPAWASAITDGDAAQTQALTFTVTNNNSALFTTPPALTSDGTLSYLPSGLTGTATVGVSLTDDNSINGYPALTTAVQTFTIIVTPVSPEIVVEQPMATIIADGGTRDFGAINAGAVTNYTFSLRNLGQGDLLLSGSPKVTISGANAADFTVTAQPVSPVLGGGDAVTLTNAGFEFPAHGATGGWAYGFGDTGWTIGSKAGTARNGSPWFVNDAPEGIQAAFIQHDAGAGGIISRTVQFPSAGNYLIRFSAVRRSSLDLANDIEVQMDGVPLGTVLNTIQTNDVWRLFSMPYACTNAGPHVLAFVGRRFNGNSAIDDIQIGGATTFQVAFTPSGAGARTASLSIANNDSDENPYDINLQGTGVLMPEIAVFTGNSTNALDERTDNTGTNSFANTFVGSDSVAQTFTIKNTGYFNLTNLALTTAGTNAGDFVVGALGMTTLAPNATTTFSVTFVPTTYGERQAVVNLASSDADENPFEIHVRGTGLAPDLAVFTGSSTNAVDKRTNSTGTNVFAITIVGSNSFAQTFTIQNIGNAELNGLALIGAGANPGDFLLGTLGATNLAPNATTTFTVTFAPTTAGARMAVVNINSNDGDEGSFAILLRGTGIAPEIAIEQPVGNSLADGSNQDFGTVVVGTNALRTFNLRNLGDADLVLSGTPRVMIGGLNAADFTVTLQPDSPVLASGEAITFTNAGFETPALGNGAYFYAAAGSGWTFGTNAGVARNGSPWFVNSAPEGSQAAFIQLNTPGAILSRTINFPGPGNYVIRFALVRRGSGLEANDVEVRMDGIPLGKVSNTSQPDDVWRTFSVPYVCAAAGDHTLAFAGTRGGADNASAIDNIQIGGATTFQVRFAPLSTGPRTATLTIANSDPDENPFDLTLTGLGTLRPEIAVFTGDSTAAAAERTNHVGTNIFASTSTGSNSLAQVFTIQNTGNTNLGGLALAITGVNTGDFTLGALGATNLAPNATTTFTVTFSPTAGGTRRAEVNIASDDGDENPFVISVSGTALAPEISVEQPGGNLLADGGTKDFGPTLVGVAANLSFIIRNSGTYELFLSGSPKVAIGGANAADFSVIAQPDSPVLNSGDPVTLTNGGFEHPAHVAPGGWAYGFGGTGWTLGSKAGTARNGSPWFVNPAPEGIQAAFIQHELEAGGSISRSVQFPGPGAYSIRFALVRRSSLDLPNDIAVRMDGVTLGTIPATVQTNDVWRTYTFAYDCTNAGPHVLLFAGLRHDGNSAIDAVQIGGASSFTVAFVPTSAGPRTASLTIANNDPDEAPFDLTLTGTGVILPEISVFTGDTTNVVNERVDNVGTNTLAITAVGSNSPAQVFTIKNTGLDSLTGLELAVTGANAGDFIAGGLGAVSLAPGAVTTFTVTFAPTARGIRNATVRIASNDSDENPFRINVSGFGQNQEITIFTGDSTNPADERTDNSGTNVFGAIALGSNSIAQTFTVQNTGLLPLSGLALTVSGPHANDFATGSLGATTLAPGATTTFTVAFSPTAAGNRTAVVNLASNDEDENPFEIQVRGTGLAPEIVVEQPAGSPIASGGSRDFGSANTGAGTTLAFTLRNLGDADLFLTGTPRIQVGGAHAADFTVTTQPGSPVTGAGDPVVLTNGGFESPALGAGAWSYGTSGSGWTFGSTAGVARNGSPWFMNPPPDGVQAAFIQRNGSGESAATLSRTINFPSTGNYTVHFWLVQRGNGYTATDVAVRMDGVTLGTVAHTSQPDDLWRSFSVRFACTNAGDHTLAFVGTRGGSDYASALDGVQILGATSFQVRFAPTAGGARTASLSIANNDSDENPYNFTVTGTGIAVPDVAVFTGSSTNAVDERTDNVGTNVFAATAVGDTSAAQTFTIRNDGLTNLTSLALTLTGPDASDFATGSLGATTLAPGATTTFTVSFSPTAAGDRLAVVNLTSNDEDETPFEIHVRGAGLVPTMVVEQPAGSPIGAGGSRNFGVVHVGGGTNLLFTVRNAGIVPLALSGTPRVMIGGEHTSDFTVNAQPDSPIAGDFAGLSNAGFETPALGNGGFVYTPGGTAWTFGGSAGVARNGSPWFINAAPEGSQAAFLQMNSGAVLERTVQIPYPGNYVISFSLVRRGSGFEANDIEVRMDGTPLGSVPNTSQPDDVWRVFTVFYTCTNSGPHLLSFAGTRGGPDNASALDNVQVLAATTFQVAFAPTAPGPRTVTLFIASNDPEANPYVMTLNGTGVLTPEIAVFNGDSTATANARTNGVGTNLFAATIAGSNSLTQTFTIQNTGLTNLTGLELTVTGDNAGDFFTGGLGATSLAPEATTTFTVTFSPTAGGSRTAVVNVASNDEDENPFAINVGGIGLTQEITVFTGNGTAPAEVRTNNAGTFVFADTFAGSNSLTQTFTIQNTGFLNLTGLVITVTGPGATDFTFGPLGATTLAPQATTTFTVTFAPTTNYARSAAVSIASNDEDENPFLIPVRGTGLGPEITIEQPSGSEIADGGSRDLGSVNVGDKTTQVFLVRNPGNVSLALTGTPRVQISGEQAADFTISQQPDGIIDAESSGILTNAGFESPVLIAGDSQDAPDGTPWTFGLATGVAHNGSFWYFSDAPEGAQAAYILGNGGDSFISRAVEFPGAGSYIIRFSLVRSSLRGVANSIDVQVDGVNVGSVPGTSQPDNVWRTFTAVYNCTNAGTHTLAFVGKGAGFRASALDDVQISRATTFEVTFQPSGQGVRTATLSIASSDHDENPYDVTLTGTGVFAPEIAIFTGTSLSATTARTNGLGSNVFVATLVGSNSPAQTFTITNIGYAPLTDLVVTTDGPHAGDFTLGALGSTTLAPGEATTFTVTFAPTIGFDRFAVVRIFSNDGDENPFDINVAGTGLAPEISVFTGASTNSVDERVSNLGTNVFGQAIVGTNSSAQTFTIQNTGLIGLKGLALTVAGPDPGDFTLGALGATTLAPGATTTFTASFAPTAQGTRIAVVNLASTDADENPFVINLSGVGTLPPDIAVEQPAGSGVASGGSRDFGTLRVGAATNLTFTVRNLGEASLLLTGTPRVALGGTNAADFTVTTQPAASVGGLVVLTNGGFESPELSPTDWQYFMPDTGWEFGISAGVAYNGSPWFVNNAPEGVQAAFIQNSSFRSVISRTVDFPGPGDYVIRFSMVRRSAQEQANDIQVQMDGVVLGTVFNTDQPDDTWRTFSMPYTCTNAGPHRLTFAGKRFPGNSALDNVQIVTATTFDITFAPVGGGARTAFLTIANNDSDENPYIITLNGTGIGPTPPVIPPENLLVLENGAVQFTFTETNNFPFSVLATTNLNVPPAHWTVLGVTTNVGGSLYHFIDTGATNFPHRFYRLRFP